MQERAGDFHLPHLPAREVENGVRVNEVFGDIVNWDFIPETAINRMTLMPSNPCTALMRWEALSPSI